jgi:hypothetical protein
METCQSGARPRRGTCAVGETRISCQALRSPRHFGQRGRESSGPGCALGSHGVPWRASKRGSNCGCRHGATPNAIPGGKTFTVARQLVVSLKSASKVGTHFCAIPQFHDVDRQTSGVRLASPLTGDPDSLVFALGQATRSFPDSDQQNRDAVHTHCVRRQTTATRHNVVSHNTADEPAA